MSGGGKSGSATIGYDYFMSVHMGISLGPIDELVEIKIGDKRAWPVPEGTAGIGPTMSDTGRTNIAAPNLFGGHKAEGGVAGTLDVLMGKPDQDATAEMKSQMGGLVPGFRGICTLFFQGLISSINPYPKPWKHRVRRALQGWDGPVFQPSLAVIWMGDVRAINPAHIIYECSTNRKWGRGYSRHRIDELAFGIAATTLYNEGFGLCLRYNRQSDLDEFVQTVVDHIGAALYTDRGTGLLTIKLIRGDYDPDTLPLFDGKSGLLAIEAGETAVRNMSVNEVVVKYHDQIEDQPREVRVHSLAGIQSSGSTITQIMQYPAIPTYELALRVAQRDLRVGSESLKRYTVRLDRRAWKVVPGDVFVVSAPDRGIERAVLRVGKMVDSDMTKGEITVEAVLDVFGLPTSSFIQQQVGGWVPPDREVKIADQRLAWEASYRDIFLRLTPAELAEIAPESGAIATYAKRPSALALGYEISSKAEGEEYASHGGDTWVPSATLRSPQTFYDPTMRLENISDSDLLRVGMLGVIGGSEVVRVDAIDLEAEEMTIGRGCLDTIPQEHPFGTRVFFDVDLPGSDEREYVEGEEVSIKLLTQTSSELLDPALAPTDIVTISARQTRPYPPGTMQVNGVNFADLAATGDDILFSWAHRDRITQQDQLVDHWDSSVGPEAGVTYTLRFYDGETLVRSVSGITEGSWTYTLAAATSDGLVSPLTVELESVRDAVTSWQKYVFTFNRNDV